LLAIIQSAVLYLTQAVVNTLRLRICLIHAGNFVSVLVLCEENLDVCGNFAPLKPFQPRFIFVIILSLASKYKSRLKGFERSENIGVNNRRREDFLSAAIKKTRRGL
jgi:hypothetical protein